MWDDHGEAYNKSWEGPNLEINTTIPQGLFRLSFYFEDYDGPAHALSQSPRDYLVNGRIASSESEVQPTVRSRVEQFHHGVYQQFLLAGSKSYQFEIRRQYSLNTIVSGIFLDRIFGDRGRGEPNTLGVMGNVRYDKPRVPVGLDVRLTAMASAWEAPKDSDNLLEIVGRLHRRRILAYRAASEIDNSDALLASWRWEIPLWRPSDRQEWNDTIRRGWNDFVRLNPKMANGPSQR
jgi:hypothetical protein